MGGQEEKNRNQRERTWDWGDKAAKNIQLLKMPVTHGSLNMPLKVLVLETSS